MEYNAHETWQAVAKQPASLEQEKIPVHPDGYVLWRGFMSEKAKLNGQLATHCKEIKKENSILKKMSVETIKNADTHVLVK